MVVSHLPNAVGKDLRVLRAMGDENGRDFVFLEMLPQTDAKLVAERFVE